MAKHRRIKTLLKILLKSIEEDWNPRIHTGMCQRINFILYVNNTINDEERKLLLNYLLTHAPEHINDRDCYWWTKGLKEPRVEWSKEHIILN
jgi:hypothetical protein